MPSVWSNEMWLCLHIGQNALDLSVYNQASIVLYAKKLHAAKSAHYKKSNE